MLNEKQLKQIREEVSKSERTPPSVFYALSDQGRRKVLRLLLKYHDICVSDIAKILNVSVPAASRQLRILEQANLIVRERRGQMICYRINKENPLVKALITALGISTSKVIS